MGTLPCVGVEGVEGGPCVQGGCPHKERDETIGKRSIDHFI